MRSLVKDVRLAVKMNVSCSDYIFSFKYSLLTSLEGRILLLPKGLILNEL